MSARTFTLDGDVAVLAELVGRYGRDEWRYTVQGPAGRQRRLGHEEAIDALAAEGYGIVAARGLLRVAKIAAEEALR